MQYGAHRGYALVELQMAIVAPHKAADSIAYFYALCLKSIGYLIGSVPGLLERLPMSTFGLHGDDFDVWVGMTDNLLAGLPPERSHLSEWYELGSEVATLLNIAGQDVPEAPDERQIFIDVWQESMERFRHTALEAHIRRPDVDRVQAQLENLVGPHNERDYANVAGSWKALREQALHADQGRL